MDTVSDTSNRPQHASGYDSGLCTTVVSAVLTGPAFLGGLYSYKPLDPREGEPSLPNKS